MVFHMDTVLDEKKSATDNLINDISAKDYLKLELILQKKGISVHDVSLSTGIPINRVVEIIEKGKGYISDINKIMGCLNISIEECINENKILRNKNQNKLFIDLKEVFQKKSIIDLIEPQEIELIKSFHEQSEKRYAIKSYPLNTKDNNISNFIVTKGVNTKETAIREYEQLLNNRFSHLKSQFPKRDEVVVEEVKYTTLELLLEYYNIRFDPFNSLNLYHIGSVFPLNQIKNYNDKYLKKVYAMCPKLQTHIIRSSIYSQSELDYGKIEEHIELMSMYGISFRENRIIEFLVPHSFNEEKFYIETSAMYNEISRLSFNIKKK